MITLIEEKTRSSVGIFDFNNSLDRLSPKLFYVIFKKIFSHAFSCVYAKHMVPFINKYTYIGDMLNFFFDMGA